MRKVVLALVAALSALLAAPAIAADGTLSSSAPTHKWEGGPMNGIGQDGVPAPFGVVRCSPVYQCDNEHLEIKETGTLTVEIKAGSGSNDLDVRLYKSDESGTAPGVQNPAEEAPQPIAQDIRTDKDAKIVVRNLKPGHYVAQVAFFSASQGVYTGTATLATPPPAAAEAPVLAPAPPPAATVQSSPSQSSKKAEAKRKKKLAACNKKAKKIKNKKKRKAALKKCKKKHAKKKTKKA